MLNGAPPLPMVMVAAFVAGNCSGVRGREEHVVLGLGDANLGVRSVHVVLGLCDAKLGVLVRWLWLCLVWWCWTCGMFGGVLRCAWRPRCGDIQVG